MRSFQQNIDKPCGEITPQALEDLCRSSIVNNAIDSFRKAKQQGCKVVVLDFDMHMSESILKTKKIVSGLFGRHEDFSQGTLDECYVVHNSKAVVIKSEAFAAPDKESIKQLISDVIEKLRT